jgi:hypothetical protein
MASRVATSSLTSWMLARSVDGYPFDFVQSEISELNIRLLGFGKSITYDEYDAFGSLTVP